jgi:hypothetical protein
VDLFSPSSIKCKINGKPFQLKMRTQFPFQSDVHLQVITPNPIKAKIRIRVPSWSIASMPILVNGKDVAAGIPGTYAILNRTWKNDDIITIKLKMGFRMTRYRGAEQDGTDRYALEYGPILMAVVGKVNDQGYADIPMYANVLVKRLTPIAGQPLHYAIRGDSQHEYMPYWQVDQQVFTCYPTMGTKGKNLVDHVGTDDLALASKGAVAASDSEYAQEPGCTSKVIDGIIATTGDFSNRWHSSLETPHPHWIQVKLPEPAMIGRVVIRFADPMGYPTSFQGTVWIKGREHVLFDVKHYDNCRYYSLQVKPVELDTFRFTIRSSANPAYPNAAQISEIELYPPQQGGSQ